MNGLKIAEAILAQFSQQVLPSAALNQLRNAKVSSVELSPCGLFADLITESADIFDDANTTPDVSIIRSLGDNEAIADVIIHFKYGRVQYLELQVFDDCADWRRLETARLS